MMEIMVHVVIDLDGVAYDFVDALGDHAAKYYQAPKGCYPPAKTYDFYEKQWGWTFDSFMSLYADGVSNGNVFWQGPPIAGTIEGWLKLKLHPDIRIQVVTDRRPVGAEQAAKDATKAWLHHHRLWYDQLDFTDQKLDVVTAYNVSLGEPDVYTIEDKPETWEAYHDAGFHSSLRRQHWNRHISTPNAFTSLNDWAETVLNLAESRRW